MSEEGMVPRAFPAGCLAIGLAGVLYLGIPTWLSRYDAATKKHVLQMVSEELPPHASQAQMDDFMRRHTAGRYDFDSDNFEFAGFMPQSKVDEFLMDRDVQVVLKVNRGTKTFKSAEVETLYTFL
ncbi:MAG TPA: hypothetical protein VM711_03085 [Sphingomicrobium sp.]|nr:hypothetical protein [Sphingomicrobium sp.]